MARPIFPIVNAGSMTRIAALVQARSLQCAVFTAALVQS